MSAAPDIWSALPLAALIVTPERRIASANPAAEQFFNASAKALEGRALSMWLKALPELDEAIGRVLGGASSLQLNDLVLSPGDAPPGPCNVIVSPGPGEGGALILIEPRGIAGRLGQALGARAAARSATGLAQMLAHEIKNPLAGITGAAQLLSMSLAAADRELTDLIVEESQRILSLVDQVESFGDQRPPELRAVNIHDVLERARRSAALGFAAHMTIADSYDPSLPPVLGDADQLLQVFMNLFKNAAEANEDGGTITIRTRYVMRWSLRDEQGRRRPVPVQVEIEDDGPGIPPALRADIFEPFISGKRNGTGLGLALVSKIVAAHSGVIEVESEPGRTVMRVALPMAPDRGEEG